MEARTSAPQPRLLPHRLRADARFPALDSSRDLRDRTRVGLDRARARTIRRQSSDSPADALSRRSAPPFRIAFHEVLNDRFDVERIDVVLKDGRGRKVKAIAKT